MREQLRESIVPKLMQQIQGISDLEIEDALIKIFEGKKVEAFRVDERFIYDKVQEMNLELDEELLTYLFEVLLENENKVENGIVFTPKYIADFICSGIWEGLEAWDDQLRVIDPGCGGGIFLVSAVLYISDKYHVSISDVIKHNIYGIDLDDRNVRRCKKILMALAGKQGESVVEEEIHILQADSLKNDWSQLFGVSSFDYIIGNPPYVNTHDMSRETSLFLKQNFTTTKMGVYNIFYAFIEHAIKFLAPEGELSYIVPNNFLSIRAATDLRDFLKKKACVKRILDFGPNMVFKPVRTYNCILTLNNQKNETVYYHVMEKIESIEETLMHINYDEIGMDRLDKNGWNLVDHDTFVNLSKIENQAHPMKDYIRTGIATLRDGFYMVEHDENGCYQIIGNIRYPIESEIVKKIYKIPELTNCDSIHDAARHIIFPYKKGAQGFMIIPEDTLKEQYPDTYRYLLAIKEELDGRDKGKGNPVAWYAYGRSQGLSRFGRKLLFPTFAGKPKFMLVEEEDALFCNGYGIFENEFLALEELMTILNSVVMEYYVFHTSYAIEGGYYCYQKKYIEKFSIPDFTDEEKKILRCGEQEKIDAFLIKKYGLTNKMGRFAMSYIDKQLVTFKTMIENAIITDGTKGKESCIRSSVLINLIHDAVKHELIEHGIKEELIYPPFQATKPEIKMAGFLKQKDQDICVLPENINKRETVIDWGPMAFGRKKDLYGFEFSTNTLVINVRSQMSSLAKNADTLFERTFAEALNLHMRYPMMVLGEVYLIPVYEYDDALVKENQVGFKEHQTDVEKYISFFNAINDRADQRDDAYKYERCTLLIVDFRPEKPILYRDSKMLKAAGIISEDFEMEYATLAFDSFVEDILEIYSQRFRIENIRNMKKAERLIHYSDGLR